MNDQINEAVDLLKKGELIAFPTETVYGLGADAENIGAVIKIYKIKKRPSFNPLICHFKNINLLKKQVIFSEEAKKLAKIFWPGPLTIILKKNSFSSIPDITSAGLSTLACRIPSNKIALNLLNRFNGIIAAPSANLSSTLSSTSKEHVIKNFGKNIFIVDGGFTDYGIESTVVDLSQNNPCILRHGVIIEEDIKKILPNLKQNNNFDSKIKSPGQLQKHYSPSIPIRLNVKEVKPNEALLNFGKNELSSNVKELNLSYSFNIEEAAKNFFKFLHELDNKNYIGIAVAPITNKGMGIAINDKLKRAAFNE